MEKVSRELMKVKDSIENRIGQLTFQPAYSLTIRTEALSTQAANFKTPLKTK